MNLRFYTNAVSQASRALASGIFILGLVLVGFGFMIYLLPKFFATLAAIVFSVVGIGCISTAVKIFLAQRRLDKMNPDLTDPYTEGRENVRIHIEGQDHDI